MSAIVLTCAEVDDLRDLYVLGALGADEADAVEEHLSGCPNCTRKVSASWEAAQLLRRAVGSREPDPAVRASLLDAIASEQEEDDQKIKILVPPPRRRLHVPWDNVRWAAAAAAVPLLISGWLATQVFALRGEIGNTERVLAQTQQTGFQAADVLGKAVEHGGAMVAMIGTEQAPTATGSLYYVPGDRQGVLMVSGLPKLNRGEVYQLWLVSGQENMSGGTFYCDADGNGMLVVKAPMALTSVDALRITVEPRGGSASPAGMRYMWGRTQQAQAT